MSPLPADLPGYSCGKQRSSFIVPSLCRVSVGHAFPHSLLARRRRRPHIQRSSLEFFFNRKNPLPHKRRKCRNRNFPICTMRETTRTGIAPCNTRLADLASFYLATAYTKQQLSFLFALRRDSH